MGGICLPTHSYLKEKAKKRRRANNQEGQLSAVPTGPMITDLGLCNLIAVQIAVQIVHTPPFRFFDIATSTIA
jgi:hypothetical protein